VPWMTGTANPDTSTLKPRRLCRMACKMSST
jgi:hypothetical protein